MKNKTLDYFWAKERKSQKASSSSSPREPPIDEQGRSMEVQGCVDDMDRNNDVIQTLPESIIMCEILHRLPVKSLIRFRSVSKYWFSTISSLFNDPDFAKRYLDFSSLFRRLFFIIEEYSLIPYPERGSVFELERYDYCSPWITNPMVLGSCNGLACLYYDSYERRKVREDVYFELWNPATHQFNQINNPTGDDDASPFIYGFGYVSSLDDYKIICAFSQYQPDIKQLLGFYVFSLRSGKWEKKFGGYDYCSRCRQWRRVKTYSDEDREKERIAIELWGEGFFHEGVLYWPPLYFGLESDSSRYYIIGFDLRSNEFKEYTSMVWQASFVCAKLFQLKGCLALLVKGKYNQLSEFWMLKDIGDWSSWQKVFSDPFYFDHGLNFTCLSQTSKCLIEQENKFKFIDFNKEALQSIERGCWMMTLVDHVESLVSPFGMTNSNEEEENHMCEESVNPNNVHNKWSLNLSLGMSHAKNKILQWMYGVWSILKSEKSLRHTRTKEKASTFTRPRLSTLKPIDNRSNN